MFRGELGKSWKNRSRSYPYSYSIPFPDVLPEFYLRVHCSLVPIASFVISAHGVRTSQRCHQSPRGIAIGKQCVELPCQHSTFPYRLIITGSQFCTAKRIFITEKSRTKPLVYPQVISLIGIGQIITGVIKKGKAETRISGPCRHSFPKFRFLKVTPVYIIEYGHRADVEVLCQPKHKIDFHLCLKTFIIAFVIRVRSIVISPSPIQTGKRIEIEIVIQAVFIFWKQMISADSQQIEADSRHISVKRDIGGRKKRINPIGSI